MGLAAYRDLGLVLPASFAMPRRDLDRSAPLKAGLGFNFDGQPPDRSSFHPQAANPRSPDPCSHATLRAGGPIPKNPGHCGFFDTMSG
jgi:hypothetical protein